MFEFEKLDYDVVVVGAGGSGLRSSMGCVLWFKNSLHIQSFSNKKSHSCCSEVYAALGNMGEDDWKWHMYDTVKGSIGRGIKMQSLSCAKRLQMQLLSQNTWCTFSRTEKGKYIKDHLEE